MFEAKVSVRGTIPGESTVNIGEYVTIELTVYNNDPKLTREGTFTVEIIHSVHGSLGVLEPKTVIIPPLSGKVITWKYKPAYPGDYTVCPYIVLKEKPCDEEFINQLVFTACSADLTNRDEIRRVVRIIDEKTKEAECMDDRVKTLVSDLVALYFGMMSVSEFKSKWCTR